jgi:pilus assembly protein CpaC
VTVLRRAWHAALALAALAFAFNARADHDEARTLSLEVGGQHVLSSEGVSSYSEGAAGVVDVRLTQDGSSFVLVGKRPGRTTLLLMLARGGQALYRIEVVDPTSASAPSGALRSVEARDNVRLDFYFVQLSRESGARVGVQWPVSYGGGTLSAELDLLSGSFQQATAGVTEQALPRLDLAQSAGWAKVLRQASVITANGTEATFSGGGELNLPVQTSLGVGIRQLAFGSTVSVQPRYDRESGRIELTLRAEVSDLASDRGSGIPGRTLSTLDSVVNLELGESLVIAGLTASSEAGSKTGLPVLSQIPILGVLFGTHSGQHEESENLIFIVPSVVDAVPADAREEVRRALVAARAFDGDLDEHRLRKPDPGLAGGAR